MSQSFAETVSQLIAATTLNQLVVATQSQLI
jgi:hypothetical protein